MMDYPCGKFGFGSIMLTLTHRETDAGECLTPATLVGVSIENVRTS